MGAQLSYNQLLKVKKTRSNLLVLGILFMSLLGWYYNSASILSYIVGSNPAIYVPNNIVFNVIVVIAMTIRLFLLPRLNSRITLCGWALISAVGTSIIFFISDTLLRLTVYYLTGAAYGLAQLSAFIYFWNGTEIKKRGKDGGIIGAIALVFFSFFSTLSQSLGFTANILISLMLCLTTLFACHFIKNLRIEESLRKGIRREKRVHLLLVFPWVAFCFVNATFAINITLSLSEFLTSSNYMLPFLMQLISACAGALIGGLVADSFGRKTSITLGIVLYGFSSAFSGLANTINTILIVFVTSGLSWGIFMVMFLLVVWGDISDSSNTIRNYYLGLFPFYVFTIIGQMITPMVLDIPLNVASLISCAIVFISIIPVLLAPELLPKKFRHERDFQGYVKWVKRRSKTETN